MIHQVYFQDYMPGELCFGRDVYIANEKTVAALVTAYLVYRRGRPEEALFKG
jgi:hypothetical protein